MGRPATYACHRSSRYLMPQVFLAGRDSRGGRHDDGAFRRLCSDRDTHTINRSRLDRSTPTRAVFPADRLSLDGSPRARNDRERVPVSCSHLPRTSEPRPRRPPPRQRMDSLSLSLSEPSARLKQPLMVLSRARLHVGRPLARTDYTRVHANHGGKRPREWPNER